MDTVTETVRRVGGRGSANLSYVRDRAVQRLEAPGALSVVVARHRELDGIDTDEGATAVLDSIASSFVPRFFWPNKPAISDPSPISRLYFEYEDNSFATTPMGDLLRDLGPWAVLVGMSVMGAMLRVLHAALVDGRPATAGRVAAFVVVITRAPMWWEGYYGGFVADLLRTGMVVVFALGFTHLVIKFAPWSPGRVSGRHPATAHPASEPSP